MHVPKSFLSAFQKTSFPAIERKTPAVLFVNDTRDQENWGSEALVEALEQLLRDTFPGRQLRYIPSHQLGHPSFGYKAYIKGGKGMRQASLLLPEVVDQFEQIAEEWLEGRGGPGALELLDMMDGVEAVVFNGEGSIYRTNYSAIKALFILWFAKTKLGIPSFFLNGGIHLTQIDPILPAMVRKVFSVLDGVTMREPCSLRNLNEYAPGISAELVPDSAFLLRRTIATELEHLSEFQTALGGQNYFCYSVGMMAPDYRFREKSTLFHFIKNLKGLGLQAVLLAKAPADLFLEQVARDTGSVFFGPGKSYADLMGVLQNASFQLSGRYHHLILGAIVGCPGIPFAAASHKVHGLCELMEGRMGKPFDVTDLRSCTNEIKQLAQSYLSHGATPRESLRLHCDRLRDRVKYRALERLARNGRTHPQKSGAAMAV